MRPLAFATRLLNPGAGRPPSSPDGRMTLIEHLLELRKRVTRAALAVVVASAVVGFGAYNQVFKVITHPYCQLPAHYRSVTGTDPKHQCALFVFGVTDQFTFRIKVALFAGVLLSSPIWIYQLWAFVAPGLHKRERRYTYAFMSVSISLFTAGGVLAYFLMGQTLQVLLSIGGSGVSTLLDVNKYIAFTVGLMLVFGMGFEFPLILSLLNLAGILPTSRMRSWRRPVYFLMFVFGAVATPSQDPITMSVLALALCALYEVSIVVGRLHDRRVRRRAQEAPWADLADDEASSLDLGLEPVGAPEPVRSDPFEDLT
jgi:sec-independent protein translocase protein TatC